MDIEAARAGQDSMRRESLPSRRGSLQLIEGGHQSRGLEEDGGPAFEDDMMMQDDDFRMDDDFLPPEEEQLPPPPAGDKDMSGMGLLDEDWGQEKPEGEGGEEEQDNMMKKGGEEEEEAEVNFTWHPNTVKILTFLRRHIKGKRAVSLKKLASDASRSAAAGCFFELLQLKSWNFVELAQREPYGDIMISAARRFNDEIPALS